MISRSGRAPPARTLCSGLPGTALVMCLLASGGGRSAKMQLRAAYWLGMAEDAFRCASATATWLHCDESSEGESGGTLRLHCMWADSAGGGTTALHIVCNGLGPL
jgi:hypothetical protein